MEFSLRKRVSRNFSLRSLTYSRNVSYIVTLFHLVSVFLVLIVRANEEKREKERARERVKSPGVHSLFPWRKNSEDLREHPRGMVHLVCVINVPRTFTYPPTLMIANVLFSVSCRAAYGPFFLFFPSRLLFFSPLPFSLTPIALSSALCCNERRPRLERSHEERERERERVRIISRNVGFS